MSGPPSVAQPLRRTGRTEGARRAQTNHFCLQAITSRRFAAGTCRWLRRRRSRRRGRAPRAGVNRGVCRPALRSARCSRFSTLSSAPESGQPKAARRDSCGGIGSARPCRDTSSSAPGCALRTSNGAKMFNPSFLPARSRRLATARCAGSCTHFGWPWIAGCPTHGKKCRYFKGPGIQRVQFPRRFPESRCARYAGPECPQIGKASPQQRLGAFAIRTSSHRAVRNRSGAVRKSVFSGEARRVRLQLPCRSIADHGRLAKPEWPSNPLCGPSREREGIASAGACEKVLALFSSAK
jgi:hypothetical protein